MTSLVLENIKSQLKHVVAAVKQVTRLGTILGKYLREEMVSTIRSTHP
jgi:hypothetical protein